MPIKHFPLLLLLLLFTACEKEIDVDYRTVSPIYVVEGSVTQSSSTVRVTTTRPMTENTAENSVVTDATVVITSEDGDLDTLRYTSNGRYTSTLQGWPGVRYKLEVSVGGQRFTSSSVMQQEPQIASFRFIWKKVLTERVLFAELKIQDTPDENNCYFMHIYRNNVGYRWAVMRDDQDPGGELQQLFGCTTEREMNKGTDSDILHDGDRIRIEVRSIDRSAYDYLYSLQQMDNTGTNPVQNFTGGCLGYFSAYSYITHETTFRLADVTEE